MTSAFSTSIGKGSLMASLLAAFLSMQPAFAQTAAPDASQSAMAVEDTSAVAPAAAPAPETAAPSVATPKPAETVAAKAAPSPIAGVSELPKMSIRGKKVGSGPSPGAPAQAQYQPCAKPPAASP